jgi:two-component system sensor kinase FixL
MATRSRGGAASALNGALIGAPAGALQSEVMPAPRSVYQVGRMTEPDQRSDALWRALLPYLVAVAAVAGAFLIRTMLTPLLGYRSPFLIFVAPVLFSMVYGGRGAAVLAGILSLASGFIFAGIGSWRDPGTIVQAVVFALVCWGIGAMGNRLTRQQREAEMHKTAAQDEAARALASSEQLRLLLEGATTYAIFMVDPEGIVTTWNSGAERILGWAAEEIIGKCSSQFYPKAEAASGKPAADRQRALQTGRLTEERWKIRKDGSEFLADVMVTPLRTENGELRGYGKVIHDVTERRAAESGLEKRERHLESILATVPEAMIVIDEHGTMISFSAAAERLFGYREEDVVRKNVSMLMPNPDRDRHDGYLQRYLETGVPRIIGTGRIVTGLRADGSTFPMKLSVGEALTDEQRLFTGFVQDLTERNDFEARLEQMKSELIHVSRLSAMGTMASTLAHELNQPLTAIAAYGEAAATVLETPGEDQHALLREVFTEMTAQSLRAGSIVRRLRDFVARGETAKSVEDLPKLINEAAALALIGSRERGISAQFAYADDATPVLVDRVQIQQVLINLMRNAMEAMDGCPERKLTVSTALLDPETVQVTVADTGPGIAPEIRDRLFEAFASTKSSGMGLGLSICRTIIEAHGGRIKASSADGGGTEFQFTLLRPVVGED